MHPTAQKRIIAKAEALATNPRPRGAKALAGGAGALRLRIGEYRLIYDVDDAAQEVVVHGVGPRQSVYRRH